MEFLKEIVKEIGDEYTQVAADIQDTERYIYTGSYIFNGLVSGSIYGGYLAIVLLPSLVKAVLGKLTSPSQLSRTFWITILTVTVCISILRLLLIKDYLSLVELI